MPTIDTEKYLANLQKRKKESKVYQKHQMTGLLLADMLEDRAHKVWYIRLAKNYDEMFLMRIAKQITENKNIKNRGAYFMRMIQEEGGKNKKQSSPLTKKKPKKKINHKQTLL